MIIRNTGCVETVHSVLTLTYLFRQSSICDTQVWTAPGTQMWRCPRSKHLHQRWRSSSCRCWQGKQLSDHGLDLVADWLQYDNVKYHFKVVVLRNAWLAQVLLSLPRDGWMPRFSGVIN